MVSHEHDQSWPCSSQHPKESCQEPWHRVELKCDSKTVVSSASVVFAEELGAVTAPHAKEASLDRLSQAARNPQQVQQQQICSALMQYFLPFYTDPASPGFLYLAQKSPKVWLRWVFCCFFNLHSLAIFIQIPPSGKPLTIPFVFFLQNDLWQQEESGYGLPSHPLCPNGAVPVLRKTSMNMCRTDGFVTD